MILFLDSSESEEKRVWGGVLMSDDLFSKVESDFAQLRLEHKVFGEVKWSAVSKTYCKRYCDFLSIFFRYDKITFHSICYRVDKQKYNAAYVLIRVVSDKLARAGINEPLYIVFDNDTKLGVKETKIISEALEADHRIEREIDFCAQGVSHVVGSLQISDLIVGAICAKTNKVKMSSEHQEICKFLRDNNIKQIPIDWSGDRQPRLYTLKIHYFDPDNKPKVV